MRGRDQNGCWPLEKPGNGSDERSLTALWPSGHVVGPGGTPGSEGKVTSESVLGLRRPWGQHREPVVGPVGEQRPGGKTGTECIAFNF